jgi:WD40 repeat protein
VYRAEQRGEIRRVVALKVVKLGMNSKEVIARFQAERQALAMMNHPNVARVFDAGVTVWGAPYFVMEYVPGEHIAAYCDRRKLNTRRRLELFIQACEAVQHAHQKTIIHRDIKPSNVLVMLDRDTPAVKVIDFGVAKALTHRLSENTVYTERGKLIGTPEYMSPEQAEMGGLDVDTRTDVYSLGVLLYQLLTGTLPFAAETLRSAPLDEMRRIIREEEPPKPSTRLSGLGEERDRVATRHSTAWATLCRELRGELEWIPLKALRKERSERYQSASELADDIRNYLDGRPLAAGPQGAAYRFRKFVLKHSRAVASAAAVVVVMLGLIVALAATVRAANRALGQTKAAEARAVQSATDEATHRKAVQSAQEKTKAALRDAEENLARSLLFEGDYHASLNRPAEARQRRLEALGVLRRLEQSPAPATSRLLEVRDDQTPLMGGYAWEAGPGGFTGHSANVTAVAVSGDGRLAVTSSEDKAVKLWNLMTGLEVRPFAGGGGHTGPVSFVAFAPDARTALSGGDDGAIVLWDVATGRVLDRWGGRIKKVWAVAYSPDGRLALSGGEGEGSDDMRVEMWDVSTGKHRHLHTFSGHARAVAAVAFSPDPGGRWALSGSHDNTIKLWDVAARRGDPVREFKGHTAQVNCVAFSPDGTTAVSASFDKTLRLWDVGSGTAIGNPLEGHTDWVWRVQFAPDGRSVVSSSSDGTVRLWDVRTRTQIGQYTAGEGGAMGVAFLSDSAVVSTRNPATVAGRPAERSVLGVWKTGPDMPAGGADLHYPGTAVAVSDEKTVLVGTAGGTLALWDALTGKKLQQFEGHAAAVRSVCLARDGRRALSAGDDGVPVLWDVESGKPLKRLTGHAGAVTVATLLPREDRAVSCGADGTLRVWDLAAPGQDIRPVYTSGAAGAPLTAMCVSPDGARVVTTAGSKGVHLWELKSNAAVWARELKFKCERFTWSPDGRHAFYTKPNLLPPGTMCLAEVEVEPKAAVEGHHSRVTATLYSPDGRCVLSGDEGGTIILWDADAAKPYKTFSGAHRGAVAGVAFSRDGRCAASVGGDGTFRLWDLGRAEQLGELERRVRAAREQLVRVPTDPAAMAVFGEWYARRGKDDWAVELLEDARRGGSPVSSLSLGRCYWRLNNTDKAHAEFQKALAENEQPGFYATLCRNATAPQALQPRHGTPTTTDRH